MPKPTTRELRLFSELAYSDLITEYYNQEGSKRLNGYKGFSDKYIEEIKEAENLHIQFEILFSNWRLVNTLQNIIKTENGLSNPLLDAFVFKSIFDDTFIVAFRGTNKNQSNQFKEDMTQNLSIFLAERGSDTQLGQDTLNPSNNVKDLKEKIYLTGHSKGGGLVQAVVCILREEFSIKVTGVTFSATPIYFLDLQLNNPSKDWVCENYILFSDKVLKVLKFLRYWKFRKFLKTLLKNPDTNYPIKKMKIRNEIKFLNLTRKSGFGYVGGVTEIFKAQNGYLKHSIRNYDKYFDNKGFFRT